MTDLHTAARQALEALEAALSDDQPYIERGKEAITALREALAGQPAQCWKCGDMDAAGHAKCTVPACGMKEQPAQQEPVASNAYDMLDRFLRNNLNSDADYAEYSAALDALYTRPQAREPEHKEELQRLRALVRAQQITIDKLEAREPEQPAYRAVKTFHEGKPVYVAEQPAQQEPVEVKQIAEALRQVGLTLVRTGGSFRVMDLGRIEAQTTSPQPAQQDPVAEVGRTSVFLLRKQPNGERWPEGTKLYTSPPAQRKPLSNGEIYTAYITATNQTLRPQDERLAFAFARAIEAAHGITSGAATLGEKK